MLSTTAASLSIRCHSRWQNGAERLGIKTSSCLCWSNTYAYVVYSKLSVKVHKFINVVVVVVFRRAICYIIQHLNAVGATQPELPFVQYLAICNNENLPNCRKKLSTQVKNFAEVLNKPSETLPKTFRSQNGKMLAKSGHTDSNVDGPRLSIHLLLTFVTSCCQMSKMLTSTHLKK